MLKFLCDINYTFGNIALSGFIALLSGFYYFFYRIHAPFRNDFAEFKKAFLPAFEMLKDKERTAWQVIFSEFPKHKEAAAGFLHIHPLVWYRRFYFNKKWNEYEKAYSYISDYLKKIDTSISSNAAINATLVAHRGTEKDMEDKRQLLRHLQCLLKIAKQY